MGPKIIIYFKIYHNYRLIVKLFILRNYNLELSQSSISNDSTHKHYPDIYNF